MAETCERGLRGCPAASGPEVNGQAAALLHWLLAGVWPLPTAVLAPPRGLDSLPPSLGSWAS